MVFGIKKDKIINCLIVLISVILVVSLGFLAYYAFGYYKDQKYYDDMKAQVMTVKLETESEDSDISNNSEEPEQIDLTTIQGNLTNLASWITIPDTAIDYPLMHYSDNDYYLHHNAGGEKSKAGSIFIDYRNKQDMTDAKTIIYGHSMKDGSMFHTLHSYAKADFAKAHDKLYLCDNAGDMVAYQLLATDIVAPDDQNVYGLAETQNVDAILSGKGVIKYNDYNGKRILVLSTCSTKNRRRIVLFQALS